MNEHNRRLLALAQKIAASYAANPNAQVVMIAGSVGRGTADAYSDIDIDVYYAEPPTEGERTAAVTGSGGMLEALDEDDDEWEERMMVEGVPAATSTFLTATMHRYLSEVVDHHQVAPLAQTRLFSLQSGLPVKGEQIIVQWRAKASGYPDGLRRAMLRENLRFDRYWYAAQMFADRGDVLALYEVFHEVHRRLLGTLLGLNRVYLPTPTLSKGVDEIVALLPITPFDLSARLKAAFRLDPDEAVRSTTALITETLALVKVHVPGFDVMPYGSSSYRRRSIREVRPGDHRPRRTSSD